MVQAFLKTKGIESDFVHSLSEATGILHTKHYSLILLDNRLSDGLGMEFIDFIHLKSPASKIIMMSAYDAEADKEIALSRGVELFTAKPFTREVILAAVNNITGNCRKFWLYLETSHIYIFVFL